MENQENQPQTFQPTGESPGQVGQARQVNQAGQQPVGQIEQVRQQPVMQQTEQIRQVPPPGYPNKTSFGKTALIGGVIQLLVGLSFLGLIVLVVVIYAVIRSIRQEEKPDKNLAFIGLGLALAIVAWAMAGGQGLLVHLLIFSGIVPPNLL